MNIKTAMQIFSLFREGKSLDVPDARDAKAVAAWCTTKLPPIVVTLVAILGSFNVHLPISNEWLAYIVGGFIIAVHWVVLHISSKHSGVLRAQQVEVPVGPAQLAVVQDTAMVDTPVEQRVFVEPAPVEAKLTVEQINANLQSTYGAG